MKVYVEENRFLCKRGEMKSIPRWKNENHFPLCVEMKRNKRDGKMKESFSLCDGGMKTAY
jgi:hypothetical protein